MSDDKSDSGFGSNSFFKVLPRTIFAEIKDDFSDRQGATFFTGGSGYGLGNPLIQGFLGSHNIYRVPARRFYDPEITTTAIYLPRSFKQKNRWNRFFFDHDELIGAVLTLHAELPHSRAEFLYDDNMIALHVEECIERIDLFSMLPLIDLEFLKIGEVCIHTPWDDSKGMWSHIIIHNPDYVELKFSPFASNEAVIELVPSDELRALVHSNKPEDQQLKKLIPKEVVRRVLTGKNIVLNSEEVTHIARRSNPYDERGTSIINRLHRLLMYEDKLREAQLTIADNFIYPLKLFKLGDPQKGWVPDESHLRALAQMLAQSNFDPNFALIYHYGINVEYITVADRVMKLEREWTEINEKKMIALGVSKQFVNAEVTYASANVGLQIQLARYKAKRDLLEGWIRKLLRIMAKRNGWYRRDARELVGKYRVSRKGKELEERLIMPEIVWHKKLMMRDDQNFLTFLNNVYAQGKGPVSTITLLMAMGLDLADELHKKSLQKKLEEQFGEYIHPMQTAAPPPPPLLARIRDTLFGRKKEGADSTLTKEVPSMQPFHVDEKMANTFVGYEKKVEYINGSEVELRDSNMAIDIAKNALYISDSMWRKNLSSPYVSFELKSIYSKLDETLNSEIVKYGQLSGENVDFVDKVLDLMVQGYMQGKFDSYIKLDHHSIIANKVGAHALKNYSDLVVFEEFHDWIVKQLNLDNIDLTRKISLLRNFLNTCYAFGQISGFQENGIYNVRIGNVEEYDGIRYSTVELLNKGMNLANIISRFGEIICLHPRILYIDEDRTQNNLSSKISPLNSFYVGKIYVVDCPIEYKDDLSKVLTKLYNVITDKYMKIVFVDDVVDIPEWFDSRVEHYKKQFGENTKDIDLISQTMSLSDKQKKRGFVTHFPAGKTLYVSAWIGNRDTSLVKVFLDIFGFYDLNLDNYVNKKKLASVFNLDQKEINEYSLLGWINKIYDNNSEHVGWSFTSDVSRHYGEVIPLKLRYGTMWDTSGNCMFAGRINVDEIIKNSLYYWIAYPQKLEDELIRLLDKTFQ